tara:strand:+ start:249 stop:611 length:363 start_codon:yes stop_codon:yes gene_type:complete
MTTTIYTLTTDDKNGHELRVFATEDAQEQAVYDWCLEQWDAEHNGPALKMSGFDMLEVLRADDCPNLAWAEVFDLEAATYLNHYECPCGTEWSDAWSCECDDRCPTCRTPCSPTSSKETT